MSTAMSRPCRGFSLVELMVYILLMAVFSVIAIPFCHRVLITLHDNPRISIDNARLDQVINQLRRDVWGAADMQSVGQTLVIKSGDGRVTTWSFTAEGTVSRTALAQSPQVWPSLPGGISLTVNAPLLTMVVPDRAHTNGGQITMISAMQNPTGGSR